MDTWEAPSDLLVFLAGEVTSSRSEQRFAELSNTFLKYVCVSCRLWAWFAPVCVRFPALCRRGDSVHLTCVITRGHCFRVTTEVAEMSSVEIDSLSGIVQGEYIRIDLIGQGREKDIVIVAPGSDNTFGVLSCTVYNLTVLPGWYTCSITGDNPGVMDNSGREFTIACERTASCDPGEYDAAGACIALTPRCDPLVSYD